MSPDREVTIGELGDKVDALASEVREARADAKDTFANKDLYDEKFKNLREDVTSIEARQTLIARTAVTALLLPVVALIVFALISGAAK